MTWGNQDGLDYLVMECIEGETVAKRLEKGALPLEQVLKYGTQIADGLDKAHRSGVVHRDLNPGNIMLTSRQAQSSWTSVSLNQLRGSPAWPR
jgi:eukaryotic-like serine/threonine-protein kinase